MHERSGALPRRLVDAAVVAGVGGAGLFGLYGPVVLADADPARATGFGVALVLLQAGALWWRRTRPMPVLAVTVAVVIAAQAAGEENAAAFFGPLAAAYSVGVYTPRRHAFAALAGLAVAALLDVAVVRWLAPAAPYAPIALTPAGLAVVIAWGVGRYQVVRHAYIDTLVAYGHQLEKDRDEQARRAVQEERRRIARELHDQVAHHLGVVSLQAGAARRWLARDPDRTATALRSAEEAARAALETMPAILHALRADDGAADFAPQPTLDALPALVATVTSDDVPVDLRRSGTPVPLPPAVELTAYRVVQEALTNVVKHAGPASVVVDLRYARDRLEVEVADDGHGLAAVGASGGAGANASKLGLVGMRERVELANGSLTTGPRPGGGFVVRATLPVSGGGA